METHNKMEYPLELQISVVRDVLVEDLTISDAAAKYEVSEVSVRQWVQDKDLSVYAYLEPDEVRTLVQLTPPGGLNPSTAFSVYTLAISTKISSADAFELCQQFGVSLDDIVAYGKSIVQTRTIALRNKEQKAAALRKRAAELERLNQEAAELKAQLSEAKALAAEKDEMINFLKKLRSAMKV